MMNLLFSSGISKVVDKDEWVFSNFSMFNGISVIKEITETPVEIVPSPVTSIQLSPKKTSKNKKTKKKLRSEPANNISQRKTVTWGKVEEWYFSRDIGYSSIPSVGTYPLGMSMNREGLEIFDLDKHLELSKQKNPVVKKKHEKSDSEVIQENARKQLLSNIIESVKSENSNTILNQINHDIEFIQSSGTQGKGCTCRHPKIDKLSVIKMKAELSVYCKVIGIDKSAIHNMPKVELAKHLKQVAKDCALCTANNCECVQLEIGCMSQVCECLRKTNKGIQCGNKYGIEIFDIERINSVRKLKISDAKANHAMSDIKILNISKED